MQTLESIKSTNFEKIFNSDKRLNYIYFALYPSYKSIPEMYHDTMVRPHLPHFSSIGLNNKKKYFMGNISTHLLQLVKGENYSEAISKELFLISRITNIPLSILEESTFSFYRIK